MSPKPGKANAIPKGPSKSSAKWMKFSGEPFRDGIERCPIDANLCEGSSFL
jgi:hypothetical protein